MDKKKFTIFLLVFLILSAFLLTIFFSQRLSRDPPNNQIALSSSLSASSASLNLVEKNINSQSDLLTSSENQTLLLDYLKDSVFKDYKDCKMIMLDNTMSDLCRQVETSYKLHLATYCSKQSDSMFLSNFYSALMIDSKKTKDLSTGLFCYQTGPNDFDFILLSFKDANHISATYLGGFSQENRNEIDTVVKSQEFYQERSVQIASTFGIDLTKYISASSIYDPPYGEAELTLLRNALLHSLTGVNAQENIDSHITYFINREKSGGIILNSDVNGVQYYHKFVIHTQKTGIDRFEILETKSKACDPIKPPQ